MLLGLQITESKLLQIHTDSLTIASLMLRINSPRPTPSWVLEALGNAVVLGR